MYGWRARIGIIEPASGWNEMELYHLAPEGVSFHVTRVPLLKATPEELEKMEKYVDEAAKLLTQAKVDVIVYACTTGSLIKGPGYDLEIIRRIRELTGKQATTMSTAVVNALRHLGINKVVVVTPYVDALNLAEKKFLEANGFKVVRIKGFQIEDVTEIGKIFPETTYRFAKETYNEVSGEVDGIFISCGNLRAIEIIDKLERDTEKPVTSSMHATFWESLRLAGIKEQIKGYGKLLQNINP